MRVARVPSSPTKRRAMRVLTSGCRYNKRGIPRCGTLLGAAYGANTSPIFWEQSMRHRLGVHRTYYSGYDVNDAVRTARIDLLRQRIPWISFKLPYSWAEMAAGRGDVWARRLARRTLEARRPRLGGLPPRARGRRATSGTGPRCRSAWHRSCAPRHATWPSRSS